MKKITSLFHMSLHIYMYIIINFWKFNAIMINIKNIYIYNLQSFYVFIKIKQILTLLILVHIYIFQFVKIQMINK